MADATTTTTTTSPFKFDMSAATDALDKLSDSATMLANVEDQFAAGGLFYDPPQPRAADGVVDAPPPSPSGMGVGSGAAGGGGTLHMDGSGEGMLLIMRERVDLLETRVEDAREEVMTAAAEGKALVGEVTALDVRCGSIEDAVTEHVAALQALIGTERGARLESAGQIQSLDEGVSGNREGLAACERRIARLETQHAEHLQAQEASREREATINKRITALEEALREANDRTRAAETRAADAHETLRSDLLERVAAAETRAADAHETLRSDLLERVAAMQSDLLERVAAMQSDLLGRVAAVSRQVSEGQHGLRTERNEIATGLVELLREESRSTAETFETQLLTLVTTMSQLKTSLEDRMRELWQRSKTADGERAQLSRGAVKASVALDGVDKRVESNKLAHATSSRQSWEAARMSAATEERLKQLEREQSKLTGALAQHRESTLIALGRISEQLR
jgi:chromosome segregation ATPase